MRQTPLALVLLFSLLFTTAQSVRAAQAKAHVISGVSFELYRFHELTGKIDNDDLFTNTSKGALKDDFLLVLPIESAPDEERSSTALLKVKVKRPKDAIAEVIVGNVDSSKHTFRKKIDSRLSGDYETIPIFIYETDCRENISVRVDFYTSRDAKKPSKPTSTIKRDISFHCSDD